MIFSIYFLRLDVIGRMDVILHTSRDANLPNPAAYIDIHGGMQQLSEESMLCM